MSFHRALSLDNAYTLLKSGAALGDGCGPLLIAKHELSEDEIKKGPIALPGEWTTAHLLFKLFYPSSANKQFYVFSEIEDLVLNEKVVAGVIIHENRFTYQSKGLICVTDLGTEWETQTNLPIPLGGIFAHRRLPVEVIQEVERLIRESIQFAYQNQDIVMPYVRKHAQEMQEEVMLEHIKLYVNSFSLDLGEKGLMAIDSLKNLRFSQ
jgi:1,4-dihydroxy-6-naphthoate synthase